MCLNSLYIQSSQAFTNLVNVFNSYPAVHEIFSGVQLDNRSNYLMRDVPVTPVVSLICNSTLLLVMWPVSSVG